ncbi:recombinase family protein [Streptomyces sp. NPDC059340]|uniref:recombinase family protein n=1 Tax=Streptomyces sp. NPDC059340 TaxID=3346806 RepID=UPI0036A8F2FF
MHYHTARFRLVPQLTKTLNAPTPAVRKLGSAWAELPRPRNADAEPVGHARLGYARASTARQSFDSQLDSLAETGVTRIFSEKISTRAAPRPELDKAVASLANCAPARCAPRSSSTSTIGSAAASNWRPWPRN